MFQCIYTKKHKSVDDFSFQDSPIAGVVMAFNAAVLFIAGILAAYTMMAGTVNTAHDGELLGRRWSSSWMPIRTAMGAASLLPVFQGFCYKVKACRLIKIFMKYSSTRGLQQNLSYNEVLLQGLARDGGKYKILVNAVAPGFIDTHFSKRIKKTPSEFKNRALMTRLNRAGKPNEVASMIDYLISNESNYITGEIISICGGDWI